MPQVLIRVPSAEEIRERINARRAEIFELKKVLKLSAAAERAEELSRINSERATEQVPQGAEVARG